MSSPWKSKAVGQAAGIQLVVFNLSAQMVPSNSRLEIVSAMTSLGHSKFKRLSLQAATGMLWVVGES